jgi:CIC family chloride channel protein
VNNRQRRLLLDSVLLGIVGALATQVFTVMLKWSQFVFLNGIAGYQPPGLPDEGGVLKEVIGPHGLWLIPLATGLGGLLSGLIVFLFAPEAEGHGTDTAIKSFHREAGWIRFRVPPLKMLASALTIGSGGSAGREGPTALITAGFGSAYATFFRRSEEERRLLVLIGMAAGLSAMFRSPIGAAIFAIEVLYSEIEFEVGALLFAILASVVAFAINGLFVNWAPLFQVPSTYHFAERADYLWFIVLGLVSGAVASLLPPLFYRMRDAFQKIPIRPFLKPAIGGLGVGIIALGLPQVMGGGYGWIQQAIDGELPLKILIALFITKMLAFPLTVSSGGSGGVFAPSLFVGAMLGGALASLSHQPPAPFVVVGMAAVFGGAARVPIATLLMVTEMTGGFELLVPAALAVVLAYIVQDSISQKFKYRSLYESQVALRSDSPAHEVEHLKIALELIRRRDVPAPATLGHLDLIALLRSGIPIDFPGGNQLGIGTILPLSRWIGERLREKHSVDGKLEFEAVALLRGKSIFLPVEKDVVFQTGDRLIAIASVAAWETLKRTGITD